MLTEGDHDKMRGFAPEPTERMTDERLAEIETALYEDTDNVEELLQALKAERAKLRAVGELPKYHVVLTPHLGLPVLEECDTGNIVKRDELEALLNEAPKP